MTLVDFIKNIPRKWKIILILIFIISMILSIILIGVGIICIILLILYLRKSPKNIEGPGSEIKENMEEKENEETKPAYNMDLNINMKFKEYQEKLSIPGNYNIEELKTVDNLSSSQKTSLQTLISDTKDATKSDFNNLLVDLKDINKFVYVIIIPKDDIIGYCIFKDIGNSELLIEVVAFSKLYQEEKFSVIPFIIADELTTAYPYKNIKITAFYTNTNAIKTYEKYCKILNESWTTINFEECKAKNILK